MKVERLTANVRPMSAYQAMELGFAVARAWYGQLWHVQLGLMKVWLIAFVVAFVMTFFGNNDAWVTLWLFIWLISWQKPSFELRLLAFLSQKMFDNEANTGVWRAILQGKNKLALSFLFWHRFGTRRPMSMAIRLLEGQTGNAARLRLRLLSRGMGNALLLMTVVFSLAEMVLFFGGIGVLLNIFSGPYQDTGVMAWLIDGNDVPAWAGFLVCAWYLVVVMVLTPFYVAAGFCVYLCRRSLLEGWDIELIFRGLARRYETLAKADNSNNGGR